MIFASYITFYERYHPQKDWTVTAAGVQKYCEYPEVLVRLVLGTPEVFCT
jgi:hypothetical protein